MLKKILIISAWVLLVSGLIVTLGFATKQEGKQACRELNIVVNADNDNYFLDEKDIADLLRTKGDSIIGQPIASVNVNKIEHLLYTNPWVRKADAYLSIDGVLQVNVDLKVPLVRVMTTAGESYYMDTDGKLMVWSQKYTPRVLVANGNIRQSYSANYKTDFSSIPEKDSIAAMNLLYKIYTMAAAISKDELWNKQVESFKFNSLGDIELVPVVGDHVIIFGDTDQLHEKFNKLKVFYSEGLNHTNWNLYDTVNLKFNKQVVCTKK